MKPISQYYPPSKYVFYPLYKFYRRELGLNIYVSNLCTWASSAVLHTALFIPSKDYISGAIFGTFFLSLGILSTLGKFAERNSRRNRTLDDLIEKIKR